MSIWMFKTERGRFWHSAAIIYSLTVYILGWGLLFKGGWIGFFPGVLLLGHGMIIAAYLIHEWGSWGPPLLDLPSYDF